MRELARARTPGAPNILDPYRKRIVVLLFVGETGLISSCEDAFVDLSGTNLTDDNLSDPNLVNISLEAQRSLAPHTERTNRSGATMLGANLKGATFMGANLSGAWLTMSNWTPNGRSKERPCQMDGRTTKHTFLAILVGDSRCLFFTLGPSTAQSVVFVADS